VIRTEPLLAMICPTLKPTIVVSLNRCSVPALRSIVLALNVSSNARMVPALMIAVSPGCG
jgi:hypothetical protein